MTHSEAAHAAMVETILRIKQEVEKLREIGGHLPCVDRNCERLLASVAMLELDVVDPFNLTRAG
jgi:hypothetical protein